MKKDIRRHHPLSFVAFLLAIFTLVAPVQSDIVFGSLCLGKTTEALLVVIASISLVTIPLLIAVRATRQHPERWKTRALNKLTASIIAINVFFNAWLFIQCEVNKNGANGIRIGSAR
jgi:hypothetical protein